MSSCGESKIELKTLQDIACVMPTVQENIVDKREEVK